MKLAAFTLCCFVPLMGGSIEGRVTNSVTGEAVGGVKVRFLDRHSYVFDTVTDANGGYTLAGLQDGDYNGEFTKDGFSDHRGESYFKIASDVPARLDAQLDPWGELRGRVVDEDGKPAATIRVEIDKRRDGDTSSDENGEFTFKDLAPGSYTVVAKPEAKTRIEDGVRVGTVPIYYPSATQLADAVPIAVHWGSDVSGIAIRLKSVPVHRVAGMVLDQSAKPLTHATVKLLGHSGRAEPLIFSPGYAYTIGPGPEPELARVESREDGTFEFPAVQQGDWRLSVAAGVDDDMPLTGVASANLSDKDLEDLRIRLNPPFAVAVTVDWGGATIPEKWDGRVSGFVFLDPMEEQPRLNLDPAKDVGTINGIFPGRYRVLSFRSEGKDYVAAIMWGKNDVLGQLVEFGEGSGPLQVKLKHDVGTLRGIAEKGEGSSVFLVRRELGEVVHYRETKCGASGAFEFDDIIPGDYYVVAFDRKSGRGVPAGDLSVTIIPLATSVRVEAAAVASVNVNVNGWPW